MHKAITQLQLWPQLRDQPPPEKTGYMYWNAPWVKQILQHPYVSGCGHSGATEAYCLRMMQVIAVQGWDYFVSNFEPN